MNEKLKKYIAENEPIIAVADAVSRGEIGHNNPPDAIDEVIARHADVIDEAQNWLDGTEIENEGQMKAVDLLLKGIKEAIKDLALAEKSATAPLYDAWKAEIARFKPTKDDLELQRKGLIAVSDKFKRKLAAQKEAEQRAAWEAANKAREEAEALAAQSNASDIEAQRQLEASQRAADEAENSAQAKAKDTVKGMRTVTKYEITDHRALLNWIAKNARDDVTEFIVNWAYKNHKQQQNADGLRVWTEKEAF